MIISQTPHRISFFGGGTDLPAFYRRHDGAVLSTTINKYIYVIVKPVSGRKIRIFCTNIEVANSPEEIHHDLVREALLASGLQSGLEIIILADTPSDGAGLGSSSSLLVGLLHAFYRLASQVCFPEKLAIKACEIEMGRLGRPVGKQDQYSAAFGGFRHIIFKSDESTDCMPVAIPQRYLKALNQRLLAFYTGRTRPSASILTEQQNQTEKNLHTLQLMHDQCQTAIHALQTGDLDSFGRMLHQGWELKKNLAGKITNPEIDQMYAYARSAGALGGKILGAGGGGYLLLYVPVQSQQEVRSALSNYEEMTFSFVSHGSRISFCSEGMKNLTELKRTHQSF